VIDVGKAAPSAGQDRPLRSCDTFKYLMQSVHTPNPLIFAPL